MKHKLHNPRRLTSTRFFSLLLNPLKGLALPLFFTLGLTAPAFADSPVQYQLQLDLDVDNTSLQGNATIDYHNQSQRALPFLLFRLDANLNAEVEVQEVTTAEGLVLPAHFYRYDYLEKKREDPLVYQVFLAEPLQPNEKIQLKFKYKIQHLPHQNGTYYLIDDVYRLGMGAWYPRVIPFRDGEWRLQERLPAEYKVNARANDSMVVISPLAPVSINNSDRSYEYSSSRAEEMSLVYAPKMLSRSVEVDGIQVRFYYDNSLQKWSNLSLEILSEALTYFKDRYGRWPVKRLTVVSMAQHAQPVVASNQLILLRNSFPEDADPEVVRRRLTEYLVYGLAQQYWGYQVKQDSQDVPWITQGLALLQAHNYVKTRSKKSFLLGDALVEDYLRTARQGWNTRLNAPAETLSHWPHQGFVPLAQGKGFTVVRLLENMLGRKVFEQVENRLLQQHQSQPVTAQAFQESLQSVSGKDLDWFFGQWVKRGDILDYAIQSVRQARQKDSEQIKAVITLQNMGDIEMPMTLALRLKNGSTLFKLWNGSQDGLRLTYELPDALTSVTLDPSNATPDIDRSNNVYKVPGLVKSVE